MNMSRLTQVVRKVFSNYPILANSVVYGALYLGAEISQQVLTRRLLTPQPQPLDVAAFGRYAAYGTIIQGPILTVWYTWLDKTYVGTATKIIAKKLVLDQFLLTPPLLVIFFTAMSLMERKTDLLKECRAKFVSTFQGSCVFWLPVQVVNFVLVPPAFRVIYVGTCAFAWINILCWIKRQEY